MSCVTMGDISAVLEYDADINEPDVVGHTAVRHALMKFDGVTDGQRICMLEALLTKGANFLQGWKEFTAVGWAAHEPRLSVAVLRWLVEMAGVDVNEVDRTGAPHVPIQHAVCAGSRDKVEYLMRLPQLDVDVRAFGGETLLDFARTKLPAAQSAEMQTLIKDCMVRVAVADV
jgi:hypothetical protein